MSRIYRVPPLRERWHFNLFKSLKKIKPFKLLGGAIKKIGGAVLHAVIPGSVIARVGGAIGGLVSKGRAALVAGKAEAQRIADEQHISQAEAAVTVADRALTGANVGVATAGAAHTLMVPLLIGAVLFLLLRRR